MPNQNSTFKQEETRILIIEDNQDDLVAYARMLKSEDNIKYSVDGASTCKKGMSLIHQNTYDCILLDFNLPDDTGSNFIKTALLEFTPCPPVIVITGEGNDKIAKECLDLGAAEYVVKETVSSDSLRHSISAAIIKNSLLHQVMDMKTLSSQDSLTGLLNRFEFESAIEKLIEDKETETFTILFMDIDHFKRVNDLYGHNVGDETLIFLGKKLKALFPGEIVARIGGDEFGVIHKRCNSENEALKVASEITKSLSREKMHSNGVEISCSVSIGIAIYPLSSRSKLDLMKCGDLAKEHSKSSIRGTPVVFSDDLFWRFERKTTIENSIQNALINDEFRMVYQPVYNGNTHTMVSLEALIRWDHPTMGSISPGEFIPIAEESNAIVDIGFFVINETFNQLAKWHKNDTLKHIKLSINVSPTQLKDSNFITHLTEAVTATGIDPKMVYIEITETAVVDPEGVLEVLAGLTALGFTLAIDDFGTGNSSLVILSELPVSILKIDQAYVKKINESEGKNRLIKSIISISENFTMMTIAEGVRTEGQLKFLMENGCSLIQGSIYSMPVRPTEIHAMLTLQPSAKELQA